MALPEPLSLPCLRIAPPTLPKLPSPFTLGASVPGFNFDPALCCKILPFAVVLPPTPLPIGTFNPAVVTIINQALAALAAYHDAFQFTCPLE